MATQKKKVLSNISKEDAEQAFAEYSKSESRTNEITSKMEQRITKIREEYQDELAALRESRNKNFEVLEVYAKENEELFAGKKSYEMAHGTIGYRTGTHKLDKLKGFTWDAVKDMVKKLMPDYIRTKEEINKEGLIAERENKEVNKNFAKCGIEVVQDEAFYITVKEEKVAA